jgi:hypothetical protein
MSADNSYCTKQPITGFGDNASGITDKISTNYRNGYITNRVNYNISTSATNANTNTPCCPKSTIPSIPVWQGGTSSSMLLKTQMKQQAFCNYKSDISASLIKSVPESIRISNICSSANLSNPDARFVKYQRLPLPAPCPPIPVEYMNSTMPRPKPYDKCTRVPGIV